MLWILPLMVVAVLGFALGFRILSNSERKWDLALRWVLTAILAAIVLVLISGFWRDAGRPSPLAQMARVGGVALSALVLTALWGSSVIERIFSPLTSIFSGGSMEEERRPIYSPVRTLIHRGRYAEALEEAERQLEAFPGDLEGILLCMDIHARRLEDLEGASRIADRWLEECSPPPGEIFQALSHLGELHLKVGRDRDRAAACLERIRVLCPDTCHETLAAQKLAHLGSRKFVRERNLPVRIEVGEYDRRLGLRERSAGRRPPEPPSSGDELGECLRKLEAHPQDWEARERLAQLYAGEGQAPDLALEQLETLLRQPRQPLRKRVRWHHQMADVHIGNGDRESARRCLERAISEAPGSYHQAQAEHRIQRLGIELKGRKGSS